MRSLGRAVMDGMESLKPLPAPFKIFEERDARLYRGAVSVLAGGPGSMKTITALNFVRRIGVPTMYFSNDSTVYTIISRAFAMLTEQEMTISKQIIEQRPDLAAKILGRWGNVRFDFNSKPSIEDLAMEGEAFRTVYGEYPHLTVVDVLMNIDHDGVAEQNYWRLMPELKAIASDWNTAMLAVHHTSEQVKGNPCQPMSAIMGKANQLPELILTTYQGKYSAVKNRNGPSDPSGMDHFMVKAIPSQARMEEADQQESEESRIFWEDKQEDG